MMNKITNKIKTFFSYVKKHKNKTAIVCIAILTITIFALNIQSSYATTVYGGTVTNTAYNYTCKWKSVLDYTATTSAGSTSLSATGKLLHDGSSSKHVSFNKNSTTGTLTIAGSTVKTYTNSSGSSGEVYGGKTWQLLSYSTSFARACTTTSKAISFKIKVSSACAWDGTSTASASISVPALQRYSVTYNANGGSGAPGTNAGTNGCGTTDGKVYGKTFTLSGTKPTKACSTFAGWNTNSAGTGTNYAAGGAYTGNAAVALYAKWTTNTYAVTYNANGGTGAPENQTKTCGSNLTLSSTTPTRTGYTFAGWNTNSTGTGTNYAAGGTYTVDAALTLYAKWNGSNYTLTVSPNGGAIDGNTENKIMSPNLTIGTGNWNDLSNNIPTREGYTFLGYYSEPDGGDLIYDASGLAVAGEYWDGSGNTAKYQKMSDITAYARWKKNTETVTFDAAGGTASETQRDITRGSTYTTLPTVTKAKSNFENWQYVPRGYQQVEYIESSGTQYIDTGYKPNEDTGVLTTYQFSEVSTLQQRVYGVHGDDADNESVSYTHYINGSGGMSYAYKDGTGNWIVTGTNAATTKMTFKENVDQRYISMNGAANTPIQGKITRTSKYNLMIMTGVEPDGSINQYGKLKLYEFNIYEDGNLIRQYVPCYRTSDNEIGLYETKEKKFYTNKGTGTFTKGNDTHIETTTKIVEGNHKLYARYSIPNTSYEVDFDANGGSGEMEEQVMEYDTEETLKNNTFTKEGYNFMGWNTNKTASGKWYREVTGVSNIASKQSGERKKTLYAQWAKKSYAKIYDKNNVELEKDSYGNYVISIKK